MQFIPTTQLDRVTGGSSTVSVPLSLALIGWTPRNIPVITPPHPRQPVA